MRGSGKETPVLRAFVFYFLRPFRSEMRFPMICPIAIILDKATAVLLIEPHVNLPPIKLPNPIITQTAWVI